MGSRKEKLNSKSKTHPKRIVSAKSPGLKNCLIFLKNMIEYNIPPFLVLVEEVLVFSHFLKIVYLT
jgi:hypothetical protein